MKHRIGAAIAAVAVIALPASVIASNPSWAVVTDFDQQNHNVTGLDHLWSLVELRHSSSTVHQWAVISFQPGGFGHHGHGQTPPDPCREIAWAWDISVLLHAPENSFEHLLSKMADDNCKITFVGGTTNGDGSVNLVSVLPDTQ